MYGVPLMCSSSHPRRDPFNPPPFDGQRLPYSLRFGQADIDPPNGGRANPELPGDPAIEPVVEGGASQVLDSRDTLQGQILSFERGAEYRYSYIEVKDKITAPSTSDFANRIKELRQKYGLTQKQLAEICTVSQVQISKWESGIDNPNPRALVRIGEFVGDPDRVWWRQQAGIKEEATAEPEVRKIKLLKDAAAAGTNRALDEKEIEAMLPMPVRLIGRKTPITAIPVVGDSMSPILDDGYIVLVDTSAKDPKRLVNQMVAARDEVGVTIKWLRREKVRGEEIYMLVPNHTSIRHPIRVIAEGSETVSIVGKVVKWIGEPPPPRK